MRLPSIRLYLAVGTDLELAQCPSSGAGGIDNCFSDFLSLHLTPLSTAYLEVCSLLSVFVDAQCLLDAGNLGLGG